METSAQDLIKNERIKTGNLGTIFFNPYDKYELKLTGILDPLIIDDTGHIYEHTFTIIGGVDDGNVWGDNGYDLLPNWDILSFGGQFAGFSYNSTVESLYINRMVMPASAFDYDDLKNVGEMTVAYDTMYVFKSLFTDSSTSSALWSECYNPYIKRVSDDDGVIEGLSCLNDTLYGLGLTNPYIADTWGSASSTDTENNIQNVKIVEYNIISNASKFGHHNKIYNSKNIYKAKLRLPYKTPIRKVEQMLQSEALVFMFNDRSTYNDYSIPYGNKIIKPLGGGSINPVVKGITIIDGSITESIRRGYYEIEVIFEG